MKTIVYRVNLMAASPNNLTFVDIFGLQSQSPIPQCLAATADLKLWGPKTPLSGNFSH